MENTLTSGRLWKGMLQFSVPYLIASFLQTFYGMADLFITGQFYGADQVTAVSVGSQVMHMLTVIIVGLAMGTTVSISHAVGAGDYRRASRNLGNSVTIFSVVALLGTLILLTAASGILALLQTPGESMTAARSYLMICFAGIPFITAYNVISSIFRGLGDTRHPMIFVAVAGVLNIALDYLFIGPFHMGASGAALATISSQAVSVLLAILTIRHLKTGISLKPEDFRFQKEISGNILSIGVPIACQDGFIQISFLVITMIANSRGLAVAAAVGIVEKIISFLFLVPSAMLSTVSAVTAQNVGAGQHERGRKTLHYGITACIVFGLLVCVTCQFTAPQIVRLFVKNEPDVVRLGGQYLRSYSLDCVFAGIHFCFSGYFSAYGKSMYSFLHNLISVLAVRIPGTWLTSMLFPASLLPMGLAAPMGSLVSVIICVLFYRHFRKLLKIQIRQ